MLSDHAQHVNFVALGYMEKSRKVSQEAYVILVYAELSLPAQVRPGTLDTAFLGRMKEGCPWPSALR